MVKKEDMLDKNGNFYETAQDLAIMFPIIEMSGSRVQYINEITYIYVNNHSGSDNILRG